MKIVQGDELDWVRGLEYRGGMFHYRNLMEGTPGTIDNFQLSMGRNDRAISYSPRHRHNFEQFRFQLDGDAQFRPRRHDDAGHARLFPGGRVLRPAIASRSDSPPTIVLQFGGPSGSGYLSRKRSNAGMTELTQHRRRSRPASTGATKAEPRQAQHGRLPGDLGARANSRPLQFPEAPLRQADHDGPGRITSGCAFADIARRVREAARRVHRAARRGQPASAEGRRDADRHRPRRVFGDRGAGRVDKASRCVRSPRCSLTVAKGPPSRPRRTPTCCASACPTCAACSRRSRENAVAAE